LAVEYDSYTHHANKSSWANDERRTTALRSVGYNVIRINTDQIYSDIAFAKAAQIVADGLGKRLRIRDAGFRSARQQLRSLLPPHMYEL
ncbi:MAG: endonuclease domain-containing protein, partial [Clostridiales Family XIII bacterium]|nr:endonuclease domain-containing protein [Clostridiales Family XIII bacterium]